MVRIGGQSTRSFRITNMDCHPVSGDVQFDKILEPDDCEGQFIIRFGEGPYTLNPGEVHVIEVVFSPIREGPASCWISIGEGGCNTCCRELVSCSGEGF